MDVLSDLLRMDTKPIHTAGLELLIGADTEDVPAFPRIRMRERIRVPLWAYELYRMVQAAYLCTRPEPSPPQSFSTSSTETRL